MRVLVVKKTTNYELYGSTVKAIVDRGFLSRENFQRLETAHSEHYDTLNELERCLNKYHVAFDELPRGQEINDDEQYSCIITVGGDGTLLAAGHELEKGGMLLGIKSSQSSVGHLCCGEKKDIEALAAKLANGKLKSIELSRLKAKILRVESGKIEYTKPILNDYLFANKSPAATTRTRLTFNGRAELHKSSGIWIATATGSSAAIYAAGGQLLPMTDKRCQFLVRELYKSKGEHYQLQKAIFDPDNDRLIIESRNEKAILAIDGQHGEVAIHYGDQIEFLRADSIRIVQ